MEFHRLGYGLLPDPRDPDPGAPVCFPQSGGGSVLTGYCSCREHAKAKSCVHFARLIGLVSQMRKKHGSRDQGEVFAESLWHRLAVLLSEGDAVLCETVAVARRQSASGSTYVFTSKQGALIARLLGDFPETLRFMDRAGMLPCNQKTISRADLIKKIVSHQLSSEELQLNKMGVQTRRQAAEQSFWGRLAYHCFLECGDALSFHPAVDHETGDFILSCSRNESALLELSVPRLQVRKTLALLAAAFPGQPDLAIHPIPLKSIFHVSQKTSLDIEVRPAIQALQASGEARFFAREDFARFRYGDLVYLKEMNLLAELEGTYRDRKFASPVSMHLKRSQLPAFLNEHRGEIDQGAMVLDGPLDGLAVFRDFDRVEISVDAVNRSWYWLSVKYGIGKETISLADILKARREGNAHLETGSGWIDVNAEAFDSFTDLPSDEKSGGAGVRVSPIDLLRALASFDKPLHITGDQGRARILEKAMTLTPSKPWRSPKALATPLRPYQVRGVDWLRFLFENQLGGLLCDDMGLGKTHQAMAAMAWLKEKTKLKAPFLVVCPTTVISHWVGKLRTHAPGLHAIPYYGGARRIEGNLRPGDVLLTSYGIVRNDILALKEIPFSLVIFDEIQNLKNRETQSYQAASLLCAGVRIGLTGTPIENSLSELKNLFDLVLPGYLGTNEEFASRYQTSELPRLRRLISPFTLRRLKRDVLEELPEKIEDLRTCSLSDMQVQLYREALATKGASLLSQIEANPQQLPYIHIFALLNLLKRICDHPALALNRIDSYQSFESGKWDLFQELLFETLDSGRKLVVFSQYLGMIAIMEKLLRSHDVGYVTLTGSSQDRGEIVRRFNEDGDCRVFLGSLKAGGTGIDLVGGSTVLHYDRWWNAAREDQATDRVHRIGQKRAVQVFKLVTEGTLEEKISAIIERKRRLMNSVVETDDPTLSKIFSREELIELLRPV